MTPESRTVLRHQVAVACIAAFGAGIQWLKVGFRSGLIVFVGLFIVLNLPILWSLLVEKYKGRRRSW
jgi:glucose dehydrogenase